MTQTRFTNSLAQSRQELAQSMIRVSEAYLYEARLDDALVLLDSDVLRLIEKELKPETRIRIQTQRAKIMRYKGYCDYDDSLYVKALDILFEIEKAAKNLSDKDLLADVLDLIGLTLQSKEGHSNTTLETRLNYFTRGLELRREIENRRGIVESLFHIGLVYQQNEIDTSDASMQKALGYFQEAYNLASGNDFMRERAHVARHIAYIHSRNGEWDRALSFHQEFLSLNKEDGFKLYLSPGYVMVGFAHFMKNELDPALECFQRAYGLAEEIGSRHFLADSLLMLGTVADTKSDKDLALKYYREALATAEPINLRRVIHFATQGIKKLSAEEEK